jgi:hypothetical protein
MSPVLNIAGQWCTVFATVPWRGRGRAMTSKMQMQIGTAELSLLFERVEGILHLLGVMLEMAGKQQPFSELFIVMARHQQSLFEADIHDLAALVEEAERSAQRARWPRPQRRALGSVG